MDYEKQYTEDLKLTNHFLRKRYPFFKDDEDVIAMCVAKLWEKRPDFDPAKAKYSTFALNWIRQVIGDHNKKRTAQKRSGDTVSLSNEIGDGITLLDALSPDRDDALEIVREVAKDVMKKDPNMRVAVRHFMQGRTQKEIAEITSLPQVHIAYLLRKFRKLCKEEILSDKEEK